MANDHEEIFRVMHSQTIPFKIIHVTSSSSHDQACNLQDVTTKNFWTAFGACPQEIYLELEAHALVFAVRICNKSTSSFEIATSVTNEKSQFVTVQSPTEAPHNKSMLWRTGCLPSRYIRIRCLKGFPMSFYYFQIIGVPLAIVPTHFGLELWKTLVENLLRGLCNPVLPSSAVICKDDIRGRMKGRVKYTFNRQLQSEETDNNVYMSV